MTQSDAAEAAVPTACASLSSQIDAVPTGPVFLASFPTVTEGPLHGAAFLYDNAAATLALVACGKPEKARRIGDAILAALGRDRFWHDGRLRNGYAAGPVGDGPLKLAGWWDKDKNQWLEDRYQVGSDNGNMAWAMLALLALDRAGLGEDYRNGAERIGRWIGLTADSRGPGGFTGGTFGHEPAPEKLAWKSTEHNIDLTAAFSGIARVVSDGFWRDHADIAQRFVGAMWNTSCNCFAVGTGDDGVTSNPLLALDAQVWPLLAVPGAVDRYGAVIATIERLAVDHGFAYSEAKEGVWTEGTAQVALLYALTNRVAQANSLLAAIQAQQTSNGSYYATSTPSLPTGFTLPTDPTKPRLYYRLPHLGATAWVALAERRFNPFTAGSTLPQSHP
ncbi:hypothetical protein [Telmatospirillum sp.]|uniref:hypothetical protein n=1 Tax=Telmatospirillum sp. TaxID=2079197 RepID=UPI0028432AFC|nr:hypothetical protein [Telmatospirillum sp.]MDR3440553.1 hypothetical protein [Telmatospirillum sp.]